MDGCHTEEKKGSFQSWGASGRLHHALMLHHSLVEVDKNSAYNPNLMIICGIYVTSYLANFLEASIFQVYCS